VLKDFYDDLYKKSPLGHWGNNLNNELYDVRDISNRYDNRKIICGKLPGTIHHPADRTVPIVQKRLSGKTAARTKLIKY